MVVKQLRQNKVGAWAFVLGVVIALIAGISTDLSQNNFLVGALVIIGIIVGLLNITGKEGPAFLLAGAVLIIATKFGGENYAALGVAGDYLKQVMQSITTLVVPATIITSLRALFSAARD